MSWSLKSFALASIAAIAVNADLLQQDAEALLQVGASVEQSACKCLKWEDVYNRYGAQCGDGKELPENVTDEQTKSTYFKKYCGGFYNKLFGGFCTNLYVGTQSTRQWCYVSAECQSLYGGGAAGELKWKICTEDDILLSRKTPQQLMKIAKIQAKDAGLVVQMAYPTHEGGLEWSDVKNCLVSTGDQSKCAALEELKAKSQPMIFKSESSKPPFGFVTGGRVLEFHYTDDDPSAHPSQVSEYVCKAGCNPKDAAVGLRIESTIL